MCRAVARAVVCWGSSSTGRAPRSQRGGRRFDPALLHQQVCLKSSALSTSRHTLIDHGEVAEWLKAAVSKTVIGPKGRSGVRIPPSPRRKFLARESHHAQIPARHASPLARGGQSCLPGSVPEFRKVRAIEFRASLIDRRRGVREAEGTRLEIACSATSATVGSNPTLSASFQCACQKSLAFQRLNGYFAPPEKAIVWHVLIGW